MSNVVQPGDVPKAEHKPPELPAAFRKHFLLYTGQLASLCLEAPPRPRGRRMSVRQELLLYGSPFLPCELVVINLTTGIVRHLKAFHMELAVLIVALGVVGLAFWSLTRDWSNAPPAIPQTLERARATEPGSKNLSDIWASASE